MITLDALEAHVLMEAPAVKFLLKSPNPTVQEQKISQNTLHTLD